MKNEKLKEILERHYKSDLHKNQKNWLRWYMGNNKIPRDRKTKREQKTINATKMVCFEMSSLIMNERVEINFSNENIKEFMEREIGLEEFKVNLQHKVEQMFALGGIGGEVIKTDYGTEFNFIRGDRVVPLKTKTNGDIVEVAFIIERKYVKDKNDKAVLNTLVRTHVWEVEGESKVYKIRNIVFTGGGSASGDLGEVGSLEEFYPGLEEEYILEGVDRPLFAYARPNTANNIDLDTPLGISMVGNSESVLRAIDTIYDSFCYEFEIGRKKLIIPDFWLRKDRNNNLQMPPEMDYLVTTKQAQGESEVVDVNINLRVEEHISAINKQLDLLANQTGFDAGTFSFQDGQMKTATEVISQKSRTFKTKKSHEILITQFIESLLMGALELELSLSSPGALPFKEEDLKELIITIDYDDSIVEDAESEERRITNIYNQGLITRVKAIALVNKVSEEEAEEILKEIIKEEGIVPEVADFIGVRE